MVMLIIMRRAGHRWRVDHVLGHGLHRAHEGTEGMSALPPDLAAIKERSTSMIRNQPPQNPAKVPHAPHQRSFTCAPTKSALVGAGN